MVEPTSYQPQIPIVLKSAIFYDAHVCVYASIVLSQIFNSSILCAIPINCSRSCANALLSPFARSCFCVCIPSNSLILASIFSFISLSSFPPTLWWLLWFFRFYQIIDFLDKCKYRRVGSLFCSSRSNNPSSSIFKSLKIKLYRLYDTVIIIIYDDCGLPVYAHDLILLNDSI